jgi:hypothetical protein
VPTTGEAGPVVGTSRDYSCAVIAE